MSRRAGAVAFFIVFSAMGFAQGDRVEMGWTGEQGYFEQRTPTGDHPLQYYFSAQRKREFLEAETDGCPVKSECNEMNVELSQQEIVAPSFPKMLQIVYALKTDTDNRPYWKSIIAETSPGVYREIFLLRNEGGFWAWSPSTARVTKSSGTEVLSTNDTTTSRDMWCTGEFWVSQKSGPAVVDFSRVAAAMGKAAPAGSATIAPMCAAVSLEKLEARSEVRKKNPECSACGTEGSVTVKFKLEGAHAVPVSSTFVRDRQ